MSFILSLYDEANQERLETAYETITEPLGSLPKIMNLRRSIRQ